MTNLTVQIHYYGNMGVALCSLVGRHYRYRDMCCHHVVPEWTWQQVLTEQVMWHHTL